MLGYCMNIEYVRAIEIVKCRAFNQDVLHFEVIGTKLQKELIQCFNGSREDIDGVKDFVQKLYDKGIRFDGIVTSEDFLAVGAMNFAKANKIKVPGELQIIGYNNSILAHCSEPNISSVDNRLEDMCIQLVKTLTGTLSGSEMPQKTIFSGELIKRGSTKF